MKYLAVFFLFIFACKKQEVTVTPEYSFVRLNDADSLSDCNAHELDCLPAVDLSDIGFQIITDFDANVVEAVVNYVIAFPCDACAGTNSQEAFEKLFGEELIESSVSDDGGFLKITPDSTYAVAPAAGNYVFFSGAFGVGIYTGWHLITSVGAGDEMTTSTVWAGGAADGYAGVINQPFIKGNYGTQLEDDAEFSGDNYLWNLNEWMITDIGRNVEECFSLCVWRITVNFEPDDPPVPGLSSAECLGTTNCFRVVSDLCFNSVINYGCNENAFGFYTDGTNPFENRIRLPLWLFHPRYPGEEKGYQRSDGQFLKLSERINKSWTLETDYLPEQLHERLRVALSCDSIEVTNENAQLTDIAIYRDADYDIQWSNDVKTYPFAKATTTVFKELFASSVNSNCDI